MEAIRFIEEVTSDTMLLKNLHSFIGKKIEIIILPAADEKKQNDYIKYFGIIKSGIDGMEYQNSMRSDWE